MRRALAIACASWLCAGCSILWAPDRDAIAPDMDAGPDAGPDAADGGYDAGPDGGPDAGPDACPGGQMQEVDCADNDDNDCDGATDCFDFDCRGVEVCCLGVTTQDVCVDDTSWAAFPTGTSDIQFSGACGDITQFSSTGGPARALISNECQPIHFGMKYRFDLRIDSSSCGTSGCDFAALTFVNRPALVDGSELNDEFRVVVFSNGSARVERAGTVVASRPSGTFHPLDLIDVIVDLEPGPDASGNDVLFATVTLNQDGVPIEARELLDHARLVPIDDVHCFGPVNDIGLYAALEGAGTEVDFVGEIEITERSCANPSQFRTHSNASTAALDDCSPLNAGAPSITNYCYLGCSGGSPLFQWDAFVDGSDRPREDDDLNRIDFGLCARAASGPLFPDGATRMWSPRSVAGFQWSPPPSSREPSILPIVDENASEQVQTLRYAYAARMSGDQHEIRIGSVTRGSTSVATPGTTVLTPGQVSGCSSLRDPLLLADWTVPAGQRPRVEGAWLLFTCEPSEASGTKSIRIAHLTHPDFALDTAVPIDTVLSAIDEYAYRGVSAPEGFTEVAGSELTVRLWYIARDRTGIQRLAYAQGRSSRLGEFPALDPYPANPVLEGSSSILGGDCSAGCTLTGASITPIANDTTSYQLVIARSRNTIAGQDHDLIPLLQPRPAD